MSDGWSPVDYGRFADARQKPFFDLLKLVKPTPAPRVLDIGCGTGGLTRVAHEVLGAKETLGVDASKAMLARAESRPGLSFALAQVPDGLPPGPFDVVMSNSALNWVPDHRAVLATLYERLAPGGQLAVQMPSNADTPFARCSELVARSTEFATELGGYVYRSPVARAEDYCLWLEELGFADQQVGAFYYLQRHAGPSGLVDFARGGLLTAYRERLSPPRFEAFVAAYLTALEKALGKGPVAFPMRRVFVAGRRP